MGGGREGGARGGMRLVDADVEWMRLVCSKASDKATEMLPKLLHLLQNMSSRIKL